MTWARGRLWTPEGWVEGRIESSGALIGRIEPGAADRDQLVVPGFIDVHVHGTGGADVMDRSPEALETMAAALVRHGTTSFLATAMTADGETLAAVARIPPPRGGARCLGYHFEGPLLSHTMRGAQPEADIHRPTGPEVDGWLSSGRLRLVTVAPEEPGAVALIQRLTRDGIRVNLGHSAATFAEGEAGLAAGADGFTHLWNAMSGLHHREPGLAGLALDTPHAFVELIADGIHVAPPVVRLVFRAAAERVALVTDAMRAADLGDGTYMLGSVAVTVANGAARDRRGRLAGSVLTQDAALRHVTGWGVPLEQALNALTAVPARRLGLNDRGWLRVGRRADWVVLDATLAVRETVVAGEVVYRA